MAGPSSFDAKGSPPVATVPDEQAGRHSKRQGNHARKSRNAEAHALSLYAWEYAFDAVFVFTLDLRCCAVNPQAEALLSLPHDLIIGRSLFDWLDGDAVAVETVLQEVVSHRRAVSCDHTVKLPDRTASVQARFIPVSNQYDQVERIVMILREVPSARAAPAFDFLQIVRNLDQVSFLLRRREDGNVVLQPLGGKVSSPIGEAIGRFTGRNVAEVAPDSVRAEVEQALLKAFSGEPATFPLEGSHWSYLISLVPVTSTGKVEEVVGTAVDLSAGLREASGEETEPDQLRRILASLPHAVFTWRRRPDRVIEWGLSEGKIVQDLGLTTDAVKGKALSEVVAPACPVDWQGLCEEAFAGRVAEQEFTCNGKVYYVTVSPVGEGPSVDQVVGTALDITWRRQQEEALCEAVETYRTLIEQPLVGAYIYQRGRFVYVNPRMADMLGYGQDELLRLRFADIVFPDDHPHFHEWRKERSRPFCRQIRIRKKDGTVVEVETVGSRAFYKGRPAVVGTIRDISGQARTRELQQKSRTLAVVGQLAAGVAHEIRNPLTVLKGFTQMLREEAVRHSPFYDLMLAELARIEFVISEYLVLGKERLVPNQICRIGDLLSQAAEFVEAIAAGSGVQISQELEPRIPPIWCEEIQLKQAFVNVLRNSVEAMPNGGTVLIQAAMRGRDSILVRIVDEGCGMSPERLATLGEPFYTTKEKGTGLGLAVTFKIVENHGGRISVESEVNKGTTFDVILPISVNSGRTGRG